jgi:hypothetical protein
MPVSLDDLNRTLRSWERFADINDLEESVRELISADAPEPLAAALNDFFETIVPSSRRHGSVALIHFLLQPGFIPYGRARELYECALDMEHDSLGLVLTARSSSAEGSPLQGTTGLQTFARDPIFDEMPLGTRKWKARLQDKDLLQRLVYDPDPSVVRLLLDNPRVQVRDVQSLASRRPNRPAVLNVVLSKPRWWPRYPILSTLIQNPYTPLNARIALLPLLHRGDLRELALHTTEYDDFGAAVLHLLSPRGVTTLGGRYELDPSAALDPALTSELGLASELGSEADPGATSKPPVDLARPPEAETVEEDDVEVGRAPEDEDPEA